MRSRDELAGIVVWLAVAGCGRIGYSSADPDGASASCADPACRAAYGSCAELRASCPCDQSGAFELDPDGDGPRAAAPAFCELETLGGGWTLVGRSVAGAPTPFGWSTGTGSIDDDSRPYSLDAVAAKLGFTEVLVGDYATGKAWGLHAYRFAVPADFLARYREAPLDITAGVEVVRGSCAPDPLAAPWMFKHAGYTAATDHFYFRDQPELEQWGLKSTGFDLASVSFEDQLCDRNGDLDGRAGMIFVR